MKVNSALAVIVVTVSMALSGCQNMTERQRVVTTAAVTSAVVTMTLTILMATLAWRAVEEACKDITVEEDGGRVSSNIC